MTTQTTFKTLQIEVVPQDEVVPQGEVNTVAEVCINDSVFATEEQLINLYQALCVVQREPKWTGLGVCNNVSYICEWSYGYSLEANDHNKNIMEQLVLSWRHYSGDEDFPIPSGYKSITADDAYCFTKDLFDKTTKYGKLRNQYINHLKKELKNILKVLKNS